MRWIKVLSFDMFVLIYLSYWTRAMSLSGRRWTRGQVLALVTVLVGLATAVVTITVPELRRFWGLDADSGPQTFTVGPGSPGATPPEVQTRKAGQHSSGPSSQTNPQPPRGAVATPLSQALHETLRVDSIPVGSCSQSTSGGSAGPDISAISAIRPLKNQTIVIRGTGFGAQDPFNGYSHYFRITNVTRSNWFGGWCPPGRDWADPLTDAAVMITSWADRQIIISGFPHYGAYNNFFVKMEFQPDDVIEIEVANPQKKGLLAPSSPDFLGAPVAKCFTTVIGDIGSRQ